jgi:hypothetical protein
MQLQQHMYAVGCIKRTRPLFDVDDNVNIVARGVAVPALNA